MKSWLSQQSITGVCLAGAVGAASICSGQTPVIPSGQTAGSVQQRLDHVASQLNAAQAEVDALRAEVLALRRELGNAAAPPPGTATLPVTPVNDDREHMKEDQDVLAAEVKQHEQTKVESASRLPLRVTGLVLFNAFTNQGNVDQVDLPNVALRRVPGESSGSVGGSLRQTWLGLEGSGPVLGGFSTSAHVSLDFFGGVSSTYASGQNNVVRLRTAAVAASSARDFFELRYDQPLISPLSPVSLAVVAQPALAWTGNLWVWAPELRWQHTLLQSGKQSFTVEAGLRDSYDAATASSPGIRYAGPGEASRQPAYEARLSYGSAEPASGSTESYMVRTEPGGWRFGIGGTSGKQRYSGDVRINTWAVTGDWRLPLTHWLNLSGEAYRGTGLGGLGGGAYRDVVQGTAAVTGASQTIGLDGAGGWAQLQAAITSRLQANAAFGQDAGSGNELRLFAVPATANVLNFYARNRAVTANLIYRPWSSVILSPEYRRITSWPISGPANLANVFTLSAGYQF